MSEEEIINVITKMLEKNDDIFEETGNHLYFSKMTAEAIQGLLDLYNKEIEYQKEKRENQKQELAILNAKQIEFNKLVNTVNSYKGQFKRQQKEIEELKKLKYIMNFKTNEITILKNDFVSKDKIKAKIEDLKENSNGDDFNLTNVIMILQSLLKKE